MTAIVAKCWVVKMPDGAEVCIDHDADGLSFIKSVYPLAYVSITGNVVVSDQRYGRKGVASYRERYDVPTTVNLI